MNNSENFSLELILAKMQKLQTRVEQLQQEKAELKQENEEQQNQISKLLSERVELYSTLDEIKNAYQEMIEENKRKRMELQQLTMNSAEEQKNKEKLQNELRKKNELQEQNELIQKQEKNDLRDKVDNLQRQLNHAGDIIKEEKKKRIKKENSSENWAVGFWLMAIFAALCFVVASNAVGFWTPTIEIFISLVIVIIGGIILITVGNAITSNPIGTAYSVAGFGLLGFVAWLILR